MTLTGITLTGITLSSIAIASIAPPSLAESPPPQERLSPQVVTHVAQHLVGTMDTSQQANADSNFVSVQMTTCTIRPTNPEPNSVYLYQEQALTRKLSQPYRQRFLQLALSGDQQRVESRTFKPSEPDRLIGFCENPQAIASQELGTPVCTVALRPSALGFVGSTPAEGCPVTMRGATRLSNVVVLHDRGMDTWDRGFDDSGNQLWGAKATPYRYRWSGK